MPSNSNSSNWKRILSNRIFRRRLFALIYPGAFIIASCGIYRIYKRRMLLKSIEEGCLDSAYQMPLTESYRGSDIYLELDKRIQDKYTNVPMRPVDPKQFNYVEEVKKPFWPRIMGVLVRSYGIRPELTEDKPFVPADIDDIPFMDEVEPEVKEVAFQPNCVDDIPYLDEVEPEIQGTKSSPKKFVHGAEAEDVRAESPQSTSSLERTYTPSSDEIGETVASSTLSLKSHCSGSSSERGVGLFSSLGALISRIPSFNQITTSTPFGSDMTLNKTLSTSGDSNTIEEGPQKKSLNEKSLQENVPQKKPPQKGSNQAKSAQKISMKKSTADSSLFKWVKNIVGKKSD